VSVYVADRGAVHMECDMAYTKYRGEGGYYVPCEIEGPVSLECLADGLGASRGICVETELVKICGKEGGRARGHYRRGQVHIQRRDARRAREADVDYSRALRPEGYYFLILARMGASSSLDIFLMALPLTSPYATSILSTSMDSMAVLRALSASSTH